MPATLRIAVSLLAAQALAGAALAALLIYWDLFSTADSQSLAIYVTVFCVAYTAGLAFTARALAKRKLAARGIALALELLLAAPAYYMITGGLTLAGWILAAVLVATVVTLMAQPTSEALA
ncbi:hypothetical protein, partial [Catelliglobosispora koreensis]|uniref:hypothetical protein n=1 Tax=Catelliglobosispora koreensis TaxID=129052 RepID=UPI000591672A